MLKRRAILTSVAILAALVIAGFLVWRSSPEFRINIEQSEIQSRVSARLPLRSCALVVACLEIVNASVVLSEGSDRIGIRSELLASLGSRQYPGVAAFTGKPRYVPGEAKVFVDDLRIDELQMKGMLPEDAELVKLRGPLLLCGEMETTEIYTIRGNTLKDSFARFALQKVEVIDGMLQLTLRRPNDGG